LKDNTEKSSLLEKTRWARENDFYAHLRIGR
jgi:hypothetical protein